MEIIYSQAGKRTLRAVSWIALSDTRWASNQFKCFKDCMRALANKVTLTNRDRSLRLSASTDSSDAVWSDILTQVPSADLQF